MQKWLIGIDEAGRGPLAGPVAVGLVLIPVDFDWDLIPGVNDSKQLSEKKREAICALAVKLMETGHIIWTVELMSASAIDGRGIAVVIREAIDTGLTTLLTKQNTQPLSTRRDFVLHKIPKKAIMGNDARTRSRLDLVKPHDVMVKLDGSLKAPAAFKYQETIIKGDAKEKVIGLASILAKVTRDRYMVGLAQRSEFSVYDFARHKGYGTKIHREAIMEYGLSREHRVSFCKNCIPRAASI